MSSAPSTLTIRLTARQREAVRRLAAREGVSEEEAVLRAVEQASEAAGPSAYDLIKPFIGSFEGPSDLSTNKAYMEGYGEKKRGRRAAKGDGP
ncbi:MAG TPA: hypothetical protein VK002_13475 [Rubricoccaceae bacterium]|nr:hypothetical protein [Rubricoccaceae bacterium]